MFRSVIQAIHDRERRFRRSFGRDISTPRERWRSRLHYELFDHAILRRTWTNFAEVAPGAYRSNHPTHTRLRRAKARGIKTILNLRGEGRWAHHLFEKESCAELGLTMVSVSLNARRAPEREELQKLIALFRSIEKPFLMHCKSGADRAGLASAIYLLAIEKRPLAEARKHLSFRFLHIKSSKTGILDALLDQFEPHEPEMDFETWLATRYDPEELTRHFAESRA